MCHASHSRVRGGAPPPPPPPLLLLCAAPGLVVLAGAAEAAVDEGHDGPALAHDSIQGADLQVGQERKGTKRNESQCRLLRSMWFGCGELARTIPGLFSTWTSSVMRVPEPSPPRPAGSAATASSERTAAHTGGNAAAAAAARTFDVLPDGAVDLGRQAVLLRPDDREACAELHGGSEGAPEAHRDLSMIPSMISCAAAK
eukprot:SAG31_NODE_9369_length_1289_cov_1.315126_2_plen_199_part_01